MDLRDAAKKVIVDKQRGITLSDVDIRYADDAKNRLSILRSFSNPDAVSICNHTFKNCLSIQNRSFSNPDAVSICNHTFVIIHVTTTYYRMRIFSPPNLFLFLLRHQTQFSPFPARHHAFLFHINRRVFLVLGDDHHNYHRW